MSDGQLSFRKSANIDRVTDKRKDSLFRLVDTDGSGTIDAQEFAVLYDAIKKDLAEELEKEAELQREASSARRRFKMLLLFVAVLVSFLAASVAANFAVIFTVVDQAITTSTTSTGVLEVKGTDQIAKTATATQDVPLIIAPALDMETLDSAKSLTIKYDDEGNLVEAALHIVAVRKHNTTFVEFESDVGDTIAVLNGKAMLFRFPTVSNGLEDAVIHEICSANATCSAFRVSGIDVDAATELAKQQLAEAGFEQESRQLAASTGMNCAYLTYGSHSWIRKVHCGWDWLGTNSATALSPAGSDWKWKGYCFKTATSPFGELEGVFTAGTGGAPDEPYWPGAPAGAAQHADPTPTGSAISASGEIIDVWYPPHMGGLASFFWSGWGKSKHIVFLAHGKGGFWFSMWDVYCTPGSVPAACPSFEKPEFRHLVFVFGSSGILDPAWGAGWSTDVYDGMTYSGAATALANLIPEIKNDHWALNCRTIYYAWKVITIPPEICYSKGGDAKFAKSERGHGSLGGWVTNKYNRCGKYILKKCEMCHIYPLPDVCPLSSISEVMVVGYSDGAGLGMYMNFGSVVVTKTVAIDFWNYNGYETWLGQPTFLTGGATVDMKIYTGCESDMFNSGPKAIVPIASLASLGGLTYVNASSLSDAYMHPTGYVVTSGGGWWHNFKWCDQSSRKKIEFFVHGFGSLPAVPHPDADDDVWVEGTATTICDDNYLPDPIHTSIVGYVPVVDDILEWLDLDYDTAGYPPKDFYASCPSPAATGRRLEETKSATDAMQDYRATVSQYDYEKGKMPMAYPVNKEATAVQRPDDLEAQVTKYTVNANGYSRKESMPNPKAEDGLYPKFKKLDMEQTIPRPRPLPKPKAMPYSEWKAFFE